MQALTPIAVTATDFDVILVADGISAAWTPGWVRCANESPYALLCGLGADRHWLQPWTADVFPVHAVTAMHVHPISLVTPVPTPPWSTLLVTVAQPWEDIPGIYPAALDRQSATYVQPAPLRVNPADSGIYTTAPNTVLTNVVYPLPPGAIAVRYEINQLNANASWSGNTIVGNVTGKQYNAGTAGGGVGGFDEVWGIDPEDTALLFSINTTGSPNPVSYWFTAPAAFVAARLVGPGTSGQPVLVRADATPAPWQAGLLSVGFSATPGALNTDFTIINGVVGKALYLYDTIVNTNSGTNWSVHLWDGPSAGGRRVARYDFSLLTAVGGENPIEWDGHGRQLSTGNALVGTLVTGQVGTTISGTIGYNQG